MTWGAVAIAGSTVIGAYGANKAAKAQLQGAREGAAAEREMFNKQIELQQPMIDVRNNALPDLVSASYYPPFDYDTYQNDPGVGFRFKEGLKALQASKAAGGMLRSGNTLRGITQFGQELGSQEYTNAFNRYQAERAAKLNPLQSLVGMGQTSANTIGGAAGQLGTNLSNLAVGGGNARASGYAGMANALASGIGQGVNYYQGQQAQKQQQDNFNTYMKYLQG